MCVALRILPIVLGVPLCKFLDKSMIRHLVRTHFFLVNMYVRINCFFMNWETSNRSKSLVAFNSLCYNFAPGLRKTPFRLQLPLGFCIFWIEVIRSMAIAWDQTSLILLCWCAVIMDIQIKKLRENFLFFEIKTYRNFKDLVSEPMAIQIAGSIVLVFIFFFCSLFSFQRTFIEYGSNWSMFEILVCTPFLFGLVVNPPYGDSLWLVQTIFSPSCLSVHLQSANLCDHHWIEFPL